MDTHAFQVAAGTVCGADHLGDRGVPSGSMNQDAFKTDWIDDNTLVAVVSDGCSDRPESGVGAALLCRLFITAVRENIWRLHLMKLEKPGDAKHFALQVQSDMFRSMHATIRSVMSAQPTDESLIAQAADDLFLCTLVGAVITPAVTLVMAAGDGTWAINSAKLNEIGPFPNNQPPYLGYLIRGNAPVKPELKVVARMATEKVNTLQIGSDGCVDIPDATLSRLLSGDVPFANPETINRELRKLNSQTAEVRAHSEGLGLRISVEWTDRKLDDDTTLIMIRRRPVVVPKVVQVATSAKPSLSPPPVQPKGGFWPFSPKEPFVD